MGDDVEVRRSARRQRTVSARREGGRIVVSVPAGMPHSEEQRFVDLMVARVRAKEAGRRPSDEQLFARAEALSRRFFGGQAVPRSVSWSDRQLHRWGSCSTGSGDIRISALLRGAPKWVVDHVLVHELAHLIEPNHGPRFRQLEARNPDFERAEGFLAGVSWQRQQGEAAE
jgi:predicted metal-dependent hydrolase